MQTAMTGTTAERRRRRVVDAIMQAANELVIERGPDAVSLREVARRADYSPAALYRYFPSKEDLINALGMRGLTVFAEYLNAVPADLAVPERLVAYGMAYARFAHERPDEFLLVFGRLCIPAQSWERYVTVADPFCLIVEACREGVETGVLSKGEPSAMAFGLWSLAHGSAALRVAHLRDVTADYDAMLDAALRAHVDGLLAKGNDR